MNTRCRRAALAILLLALAPPAPARADLFGPASGEGAPAEGAPPLSPSELAEALPRDWRGTFHWEDGVAYYVELEIMNLSVDPGGSIAFTAESRWQPGELEARMSGRIDPASLGVAIWEIPGADSAESFQSDGLYSGVLAPDLWDLRATWVTTMTGAMGTLVLVAKAMPRP